MMQEGFFHPNIITVPNTHTLFGSISIQACVFLEKFLKHGSMDEVEMIDYWKSLSKQKTKPIQAPGWTEEARVWPKAFNNLENKRTLLCNILLMKY